MEDVSEADWRKQIDGLLEAKSMVLCMTNYGMLKFWKSASRCDGKTWAEKRADECVRLAVHQSDTGGRGEAAGGEGGAQRGVPRGAGAAGTGRAGRSGRAGHTAIG